LRDYGKKGQIGLEDSPEAYVEQLVVVFREVRRVLRPDGTLWLNLSDTYGLKNGKRGGVKEKDLIGIPWMAAFALRADGWYLRLDIIWNKPNPQPESVEDRPTRAHEYLFLLSKKKNYYYDAAAIAESKVFGESNGRKKEPVKRLFELPKLDYSPRSKRAIPGQTLQGTFQNRSSADGEYDGHNKRSVWTVKVKPYTDAHFATYPEELIRPCILAGSPKGGVVLDTFTGSGTTLAAAKSLGRRFIGCEINPEYREIAQKRLDNQQHALF
jgi:DNA modification methylase